MENLFKVNQHKCIHIWEKDLSGFYSNHSENILYLYCIHGIAHLIAYRMILKKKLILSKCDLTPTSSMLKSNTWPYLILKVCRLYQWYIEWLEIVFTKHSHLLDKFLHIIPTLLYYTFRNFRLFVTKFIVPSSQQGVKFTNRFYRFLFIATE